MARRVWGMAREWRWQRCRSVSFCLPARPGDDAPEALVATYTGNPTLTGQRATLRATDEDVAIARSAGRPTRRAPMPASPKVDGLRQFSQFDRQIGAGAHQFTDLPGCRVRTRFMPLTRASAAAVHLAGDEGDVFVQAVSAYMDVLRDRSIVELNITM